MISIKNKVKWSWKIEIILLFSILISLALFFLCQINEERQLVFASPDVLTIRPNATGTVTGIEFASSTDGSHWNAVNETPSDVDATYVEIQTKNVTQYDLYQMADHTTETTAINSVTVWVNARESGSKAGTALKTVIKTKTTEFRGGNVPLVEDAAFAFASTTYLTNPSSTVAWTWTEIDNLEAGVEFSTPNIANANVRATQVWVDVDYQPPTNNAPVVEAVNLTPDPITLTENTTTTVTCTSTISDQQTGDDVVSATATIYRSGVTATSSCSANDNNCYQNITPLATSTSGNYFYATFTQDLWFHAEPTDEGAYATAQGWNGQNWQCYVIAEDSGGLTGDNTDSAGPELNSLEALTITSSLDYGNLAPGGTSTVGQQITVTSTGNIPIDIKLRGTDDFADNGNTFGADQQEYATSEVAYGSGTILATTSYATLELESLKPEQNPFPQATATDIIFWKIAIPPGQPLGTYYSTTSAAATED